MRSPLSTRSIPKASAKKAAGPAVLLSSLLYERLALSKDKKGLTRLATRGHKVQQAADVFKDPVVIEFLGMPSSHKLEESSLEEALIANLQHFLLELGKGFAFVSRQERIRLHLPSVDQLQAQLQREVLHLNRTPAPARTATAPGRKTARQSAPKS